MVNGAIRAAVIVTRHSLYLDQTRQTANYTDRSTFGRNIDGTKQEERKKTCRKEKNSQMAIRALAAYAAYVHKKSADETTAESRTAH